MTPPKDSGLFDFLGCLRSENGRQPFFIRNCNFGNGVDLLEAEIAVSETEMSVWKLIDRFGNGHSVTSTVRTRLASDTWSRNFLLRLACVRVCVCVCVCVCV